MGESTYGSALFDQHVQFLYWHTSCFYVDWIIFVYLELTDWLTHQHAPSISTIGSILLTHLLRQLLAAQQLRLVMAVLSIALVYFYPGPDSLPGYFWIIVIYSMINSFANTAMFVAQVSMVWYGMVLYSLCNSYSGELFLL